MESTEMEKSVSSEETSQLNRNRSFKSKQLVRSQALRETHSPPRALSPAQPTPTVTISTTTVANSTPSVGNSSPSVNTATNNVENAANNIENATNNAASKITTSPRVENSPPSVGNYSPSVGNPSPTAVNSGATAEKASNERTLSVSDDSSHVSVRCSDVVNSSDVKPSDSDDYKKKLPVEIQITSGSWDNSYHERHRPRRWYSDAPRDLLSNNPRVNCVCGYCAACVHCRGRRRRHYCPTKQDSGIGCPDDCADCPDNDIGASNNDTMRKSSSLDVDDQPYYCRCPERKEPRPKPIPLTRNDSDERSEPTGPELVEFIKETLNKNIRDRLALLKIEKELHSLVNDTGRCIVRFPVMTSYGRMLVHRCASLFQLSHHIDMANKHSVLVSKSGTAGGRIPCTSFKEWCTATFPPSPMRHAPDPPPHAKSILKRDTNSLDEPGAGSLANNRSKSLEQREREYERVRRRIFSSQDETQWPWLTSGPIKLLTPEAGGRNKLLKVQSLEGSGPGSGTSWRGARGPVSKSHSFGGYAAAEPHTPRLLSRQGDLASSSWRLSPSSSGYKTLSLRSTDSITPSPTGGASPEPACGAEGVVWCVTDMAAVPPGALLIHPQTGRPLTNPDGTVYQFDPANPPVLYDPGVVQNDQQKLDPNCEKRRGRLEKQHSFIDNECDCQPSEECRTKCCCECRRHEGCQAKIATEKEITTKPASPFETNTQIIAQEEPTHQPPEFEQPTNQEPAQYEAPNQQPVHYEAPNQQPGHYDAPNQQAVYDHTANQKPVHYDAPNQQPGHYDVPNQQAVYDHTTNQKPVHYDASNQQAVYDHTTNQKPVHYIAPNQQPGHYETPNQQPGHYESPSQQPVHYESPNQQPGHYETTNQQPGHYETTNQQPVHYEPTNQQPAHYEPPNQQPGHYEPPNHQPVYEHTTNQKPYEAPRNYEPANQNFANNVLNNRPGKMTNEGQEIQYMPYAQAFRPEEVTSPPQMVNHYISHEVNMQVMSQPKVAQLPIPDPNMRAMPMTNMTNMVYQAPMPQPYPYPCRIEPPLQMYPTVHPTEDHKLAPSPHANDTAFRIDPSYPYAAVDYSASCGACADNTNMQHQQRSYSVGYGQVEVPPVLPHYPVQNVLLPQPHVQHYPQYAEQAGWSGAPHKLLLPELYPVLYPQPAYQHYNILYPQVIQQPYPICQPVYPVIDKQQDQRRNSLSNRPSKRNSISGSARATPSTDEKVTYEDSNRQNSEIAAKIQQIKTQMARLDTKDYRFDRDKRGDWRRRNSGSGILGNCPVNNFNGRVMGRGPGDDRHLTTAARAIVDTIRNMQAKNTYQDTRRDYQRHDKHERPEYRRRDRDDGKDAPDRPEPRARGLGLPVYRQPYLFRQMTPGTWCRRSPGPVHPLLNQPRRPHPDTRNPRR